MTGVTTFMIDGGMDTGHIIYREQCRILDTDTAGDVHDKLMETGAKVVVQTVDSIIDKNIELRLQKSFIQGSEVLRPAPKLTRELCHIDWNGSTRHIYNLIRGLSPYPAAYTELVAEGKEPVQLKIFFGTQVTGDDYMKMLAENSMEAPAPGTVLSDGRTYLAITTADGAISITDLQLAGKKRMDVKDFLIGFRDPGSYATTAGTSPVL
jgi:methionyl-tRNA formyltransferase